MDPALEEPRCPAANAPPAGYLHGRLPGGASRDSWPGSLPSVLRESFSLSWFSPPLRWFRACLGGFVPLLEEPRGAPPRGEPQCWGSISSDATTLLASGERPTAFEKSKHSSKRKAHSNHDPQAAGIQITGPLPQESPRGSEAGFRDHHGIFRGKRCVAKTVFPSQKFRFLLELFIPLYQADRRWTDEFF